MKITRALTIAGSDSGGGAGVAADLKTFSALSVYGMSAVTSVTAQNTKGISAIQDVEPEVVRAQIEAVVEDIGVDAAKTGMLRRANIISVVAEEFRKYRLPLVVDPIMVAKDGTELLKEGAFKVLVEELLPLATVVTPNKMEAEALSKLEIRELEDMKRAAKEIASMGPRAVVVKGGHMESEEAADVLYLDGAYELLRTARVQSRSTHGAGCVFASATAAGLAKGSSILESVRLAKEFATLAIRFGFELGGGVGPTNPMANLYNEAERYRVLKSVREAIEVLEGSPEVAELLPEAQSNVAMALPYALTISEVAAVPGRVVRLNGRVKASSWPEFGSSKHVAQTVLTAMKHERSVRAGMNIRFSEELLEICKRAGLTVSFYDRSKEPPEVKRVEGMSTAWGAEQAIASLGRVPDVIYHRGDYGKEAMMTLLGKTAKDVAGLCVRMAKAYASSPPKISL